MKDMKDMNNKKKCLIIIVLSIVIVATMCYLTFSWLYQNNSNANEELKMLKKESILHQIRHEQNECVRDSLWNEYLKMIYY